MDTTINYLSIIALSFYTLPILFLLIVFIVWLTTTEHHIGVPKPPICTACGGIISSKDSATEVDGAKFHSYCAAQEGHHV